MYPKESHYSFSPVMDASEWRRFFFPAFISAFLFRPLFLPYSRRISDLSFFLAVGLCSQNPTHKILLYFLSRSFQSIFSSRTSPLSLSLSWPKRFLISSRPPRLAPSSLSKPTHLFTNRIVKKGRRPWSHQGVCHKYCMSFLSTSSSAPPSWDPGGCWRVQLTGPGIRTVLLHLGSWTDWGSWSFRATTWPPFTHFNLSNFFVTLNIVICRVVASVHPSYTKSSVTVDDESSGATSIFVFYKVFRS